MDVAAGVKGVKWGMVKSGSTTERRDDYIRTERRLWKFVGVATVVS